MNHFSLTFSPENEPVRIDLFLSREMEGESRAAIQRYIETGCVLVDGKEVRTSLKLKGGRADRSRPSATVAGRAAGGGYSAGSIV